MENLNVVLIFFQIFMLVCVVGLASAYPGDVFRYADEDTKQSHYMEGEPGTRVSGGWAFESPEGKNYELTYQADELGFQPQADYIPLQVIISCSILCPKKFR